MMRHELTIRSNDRGLSEIILHVPRGNRGEGLDLIERVMPAIRELSRRTQMPGSGAASETQSVASVGRS